MKKRIRGPFRQAAGVLSVLILLAGSGCRDNGPIRIGYVGGLTGRTADLGISGRDGVVLAVEEINRRGGVGGRQVELLVRDDRQEPEGARQAVQELAGSGALAIIGPMTSDMAIAAVPAANAAGRVLLSPTVSTERLSGKKDSFFRIYPTSPHAAAHLAEVARRRLSLARIAIAYDERNRSHSEPWQRTFEQAFEKLGGRVEGVETFRSGADSSLFDLASRLARTGGDGIFIIASAMDTAILCQQLKKLGNTRPVLTSEWAATDELIAFGGRAVEGVTFLQTFDRDSSLARYQEFRRAFRDRFRTEPRFASVHGYDAANILFSTLSRSTDPKDVAEVLLEGAPYPGVQSELAFTPDGDIRRPLFLTTVRDGRFVRLKAP